MQIVPKEGTFPNSINWVSNNGLIYSKGMRAAYNSISSRSYTIMTDLGAVLPECFVLAQEVHVSPKEALFRILIVDDEMCAEKYESAMEELDRVAILMP